MPSKNTIISILENASELVGQIRNPNNLIAFSLQLIHFNLSGKFFSSATPRKKDIDQLCQIHNIDSNLVNLSLYNKPTRAYHQKKILHSLGWRRLDSFELKQLKKTLDWHAKQQLHPREIFEIGLTYLLEQKIVIPAYSLLANLITDSYLEAENSLITIIDNSLSEHHKKILDNFICSEDKKVSGITYIKSLNQSAKHKDIVDSLKTFKMLKAYHEKYQCILVKIKLSQNATKYYAEWVKRSKLFQLKQFSNRSKAYLYLIAYLAHEYYTRHDNLLVIFMKLMKTALNTIEKEIEENKKSSNKAYKLIINKLMANADRSSELFAKIKNITEDMTLNDAEKISLISYLIRNLERNKMVFDDTESDTLAEINTTTQSDDFYNILRKSSTKMQNKLSGIIKSLDVICSNRNYPIYKAIIYFQVKDGTIYNDAPIDFLEKSEQEKTSSANGVIDASLYKALLFKHIYENFRNGNLSLNSSYDYLPIDKYMIDKETWKHSKEFILASCNLDGFGDVYQILETLSTRLHDKYHMVNKRYLNNENTGLKLDKKGKFYTRTPSSKHPEEERFVPKLLQEDGVHSILDVLSQINNITGFTECFKHHSNKHVKMKPTPGMIYAGLLGRGCNIGISKIASISKGIQKWSLKNTVNWFFGINNLNESNNRVVSKIKDLALPKIFQTNGQTHTSSDGQKMKLGVDCLHANYSFKYYGKDQGIAIYSFIDNRHVLFHDIVITPSEREAAYVIDGLIGNKLIKSDIHSTDTHGYTEIIFGLTHILGTSFAPRIKKIGRQSIYSFTTRSLYAKQGYKILPSGKINAQLIVDNWDLILRFIASILKKTTTASQVLTRLNSYSRDNPLYKALKEFGRAIKSLFILTYYDDVSLRQKIEGQLNKIELANKFTKAIFFSNNQEFRDATKNEQEVTVACKSLIQNCIILWNYLFITKRLHAATDKEKYNMIDKIRSGSILCWKHINLFGEYDFTKQPSNDIYFEIDQLIKVKISKEKT